MLNASIKLSVLCEGNCALIITENYNNLRIRIVRPKKLIKKILQLDSFLNSLYLTDILYLISKQSHDNLALRELANSAVIQIK